MPVPRARCLDPCILFRHRMSRCSWCNLQEFILIVRNIEHNIPIPQENIFPWIKHRMEYVTEHGEQHRLKQGHCPNSRNPCAMYTCFGGYCIYCILDLMQKAYTGQLSSSECFYLSVHLYQTIGRRY